MDEKSLAHIGIRQSQQKDSWAIGLRKLQQIRNISEVTIFCGY